MDRLHVLSTTRHLAHNALERLLLHPEPITPPTPEQISNATTVYREYEYHNYPDRNATALYRYKCRDNYFFLLYSNKTITSEIVLEFARRFNLEPIGMKWVRIKRLTLDDLDKKDRQYLQQIQTISIPYEYNAEDTILVTAHKLLKSYHDGLIPYEDLEITLLKLNFTISESGKILDGRSES